MGRPRTKSPSWLPKRCYPHRQQILYYPRIGKPVALGPLKDPGACLKKYAEIVVNDSRPRLRNMGDVIDRYLIEIIPKLAPRTQEDYRAYCGKLKFSLGHMEPDDITIADLYAYHDDRRAPIRANREITVLGVIYRHAIRWRAATINPVSGFLFADEKARERAVTGSERRRFRHHCPDWLQGYLTLKHITGRRQGEMLKLTLFSEKTDGIAFQILKKRKPRILTVRWTPLLRRTWAWLKALSRPEGCPYIFWSTKGATRGQALSSRGFKSAWQRAQEKWIAAGGVPFWEHDLRAASATAAESDERARELLDHGDVRTSRRSYRRGEQKVKPLR